jgi:conjugal transfer pilin signal peptidase TrbI
MTPIVACLSALRSRFKPIVFRERLVRHLKGWGMFYVVIGGGACALQAHFTLAVNLSPSLQHRLFIIHKDVMPKRGDLVAFRCHTPSPAGTVNAVKVLTGIPGDAVARVGRQFYVNGFPAGLAKTHSLKGTPLELGPTGVIPERHFHVSAPHPDSLDSRYALVGWIARDQIIGRAYGFF